MCIKHSEKSYIKNQIKQIRIIQGLTLEDVARRTGLSVGYICHLEKGSRSNPSYNAMVKIAKALNKDIGEVFEGTNTSNYRIQKQEQE